MTKIINRFNLWFFIIAVINFTITLFTDKFVFKNVDFLTNHLYIITKLIVLILLITFWQYISVLVKKLQENDPKTKTFIKYFLIYFSIMLVFLIMTWPGVWRHDELYILNGVVSLNFITWHHWLTPMYYLICLCICPFPVGIIFIQITLISAIVSYIITQLNWIYPNQSNWLILAPLLFPSVIINNLYPLRMTLYSYIEIFLFAAITFKYLNKSSISYKNILFWGFLTSIVASWRSESIFYIIGMPLVIFILLKERLSIKQIVSLLLTTVLISSSIIYIQNSYNIRKYYTLMGIVTPLREIVKTNFKSNDKQGDLKVIGNIFNLKYFRAGSADQDFWQMIKLNLSDKELFELEKVYFKLIVYNLPFFTNERMHYFTISKLSIEIPNSIMNDDAKKGALMVLKTQDLQKSYGKFRFLEFRDKNGNVNNEFLNNLFYSPVLSFILLIILLFTGLIMRNKLIFLFSFLLAIQTLITIVGAPAALFMYYLPCYMYTGICSVILGLTAVKKGHIDSFFND